MEPPAWPTSVADLAEWAVYADFLLSNGDPRGEWIANELALPAEPTQEARIEFRAARPGSVALPDGLRVATSLGHIRAIAARRVEHEGGVAALAGARELLARPDGCLVEEVALSFTPPRDIPVVCDVLAALPRTCTYVELDLCHVVADDDARRLIDAMPSSVRTLALAAHRIERQELVGRDFIPVPLQPLFAHIDDRFERVEYRRICDPYADRFAASIAQWESATETIAKRISETSRVVWHTSACRGPMLGDPRISVGMPGDIAVVDLRAGRAMVLWRDRELERVVDPRSLASLDPFQPGIRGIRELLAPQPLERDVFLGTDHTDTERVRISRHTDGAWSLHLDYPRRSIRVDGVSFDRSVVVPARDGLQIATEHWAFALVLADLTARVQSLVAA